MLCKIISYLFSYDFYFYPIDYWLLSQWWPFYPYIYILSSLNFLCIILKSFYGCLFKILSFHLFLSSVLFSFCLFWLIFLFQTTDASNIRRCFSCVQFWLLKYWEFPTWWKAKVFLANDVLEPAASSLGELIVNFSRILQAIFKHRLY